MSLKYEPVSVEIESCTDLVQFALRGRIAWFGEREKEREAARQKQGWRWWGVGRSLYFTL